MNGIAAGLGSLLQIKPIMTMHDGKPGAVRVRTRQRATERLLEMLHGVGALERVAIVHTHAPERVAELRERAGGILPDGDVAAVDITPVIGAHISPGAAGFAVVARR